MNPSVHSLRRRRAGRLLILNEQGRVLLFQFVHSTGALAGQTFWGTPGGEVKDDETYILAAQRECFEETGHRPQCLAVPVALRKTVMTLPSGEVVLSDEQYFLVRVAQMTLETAGRSAEEAGVIRASRWWTIADLECTDDIVWPANIPEILRRAASVGPHATTFR